MFKIHYVSLLFLISLISECPFIPVPVETDIKFTENGIDTSAGNVACYIIETPAATYYLEKIGAGLSSMVDREGNDWIGFHNECNSGSAGEYRGFPNAVFDTDGNYFHPLNVNTDSSTTEVIYQGPDRVTIIAVSQDTLWQGRWDFYPTHCSFTMEKISEGHKYWILYEGTPGGQCDETDWWMTSHIDEKKPFTEIFNSDIPYPEWIVFGDKDLNRSIFLLHHEDDSHVDRYYQMNNEMTVFGFGRRYSGKFLDQIPNRFTIGFVESTRHDIIAEFMYSILETEK